MTTYELETGTLMFIPVPEDSHSFRFIETKEGKKNQLHYTILTNEVFYTTNQRAELIDEGYIPLSLFSQLKEEDLKEVMPKMPWGENNYKNFNLQLRVQYVGLTAIESIHSLAKHLLQESHGWNGLAYEQGYQKAIEDINLLVLYLAPQILEELKGGEGE